MWPLPGEGIDRVLAAESVVERLYRRALREWAPAAHAAALPAFRAGGAVTAAALTPELPVDAAAVEAESSWGPIAESVVVAGVGVLFAAAAVEAMKGIALPSSLALASAYPALAALFPQESAGKPLVAPPSGGSVGVGDLGKRADGSSDNPVKPFQPNVTSRDLGGKPQESAGNLQVAHSREVAVMAIVNEAAPELDIVALREAVRMVDETPALAAARDKVVDAQRTAAARVPAQLAQKIEMAVRGTPTGIDRRLQPDGDTATLVLERQRTAAATVLDPDGQVLADLAAADSWHQSAAVQNHAVMAVAQLDEDRGELQKVWIATLDGKTRPTHWAADGARVDLDAPFIVGGEPLMFPADPTGSPGETYSCRCRMGIIARDEALPDEVDRHTERLNGRDSVARNRKGRSQQAEIARRAAEGNTRARDNRDGVGTVAAAAPTEGETMSGYSNSTYAVTDTEERDAETFLTFTDALFAVIGVPTDDRRMLHPDIELTMRECPLPLQWQERTGEGHKGAVTVGVVESMRRDGDKVFGSGYMLNNEHAVKALDLIQHGVAKPSVDMADATAVAAFADGTVVTEANFNPETPVFEAYKKGTVTAATIVAIPAFGQTSLSLNADREERGGAAATEEALVAAAHEQPVYEPAMFADADPNLLRAHRLRMSADGHVSGFLATWKDSHRSVGLGNIKPPRSATNYEHFHTSPGVHLTDGTVLPVGRLTIGIGHAPTRGVSSMAAQAHYDNVETCWALGRVTEHRLGIYFSGIVAPWASPERVQMGLASPVSGDWRPIGPNRNLELVAVLGVNTPGFLCKVETDESGAPAAMVASMGIVDESDSPATAPLSLDDIRLAMQDVLDEREAQADRAAQLAATAARALTLFGEPEPPLSPTEIIGEKLAEMAATEVDEFGIKKVRDSNYWGLPAGTPIKAGMKPKGKKQRNAEKASAPGGNATSTSSGPKVKPGVSGRSFDGMSDDELRGIVKTGQFQGKYDRRPKTLTDAEMKQAKAEHDRRNIGPRSGQGANSDTARQQRGGDAASRDAAAKADKEKRNVNTEERTRWESKLLAGGQDHAEREVADIKDKIQQLDRQIADNRRKGVGVDEIVKRKTEMQRRLSLAQKAAGKKA